ncbi:Glu-tRNA(Gln) amidotransferase subunit GatE [Candidatus Woesearchaeota archaeon]|nr:Glu-tRNA(Gln) amidotransferase subunit GatE [Candidatus Woesearchaeota archaeon]
MKNSGLKCGIEIHQQLEGKKLFCDCPTLLRDDQPHFVIKRKLRASAGERGEVDIAARQEQLRNKNFVYEGYKDTNCLVETDSEPPREMNKEALYTVLQFCTMVKAEVIPVVQVMRKTVIDGSNTSGFQRTALVAWKGKISTSEGEVGIIGINLEEDACKIISESDEEKRYRLDRLGIPLIEIGTAPDIKSPEQCQETAKKIGLLLRSLPGVKRGLGTIRQDLNVSIREGTRVEIKGAQDLKMLSTWVALEVKRQEELLKIREELTEVVVKPLEISDVTPLFKSSISTIILKALGRRGKILAMNVRGFKGYIGRELQPGYRLGTELAGRAKIKAGVGGIFHSDELPNYGITAQEVDDIKKELQCGENDAFVMVADVEEKAQRALEAVYERVVEVFKGVPGEVRRANPDGTTSYMRPMPGAARMYPETDVPLVRVNIENVEVPEALENKMKRYQEEWGLSKDLAEFVAKSDLMNLFEEMTTRYGVIKPAFIAETLISTPLEIKRKYTLDSEKLQEDDFRLLFFYLDKGKIHKDIVLDVLIDMINGNFDVKRYEGLSTEELHKGILEVIAAQKGAPISALMGLCMKRFAGKASGKVISEHLKRILEEGHG